MYLKSIFIVVGLALLAGFINSCDSSAPNSDQQYRKQIDAWHQNRIKNLQKTDSWLSLAGLYWLEKGENSFGSDSANAIIFPDGKAPAHIGVFTLQDSTVHVSIAPHISVTADDKSVSTMPLEADVNGNPTILHYKSLSWYVIKRGDKWGIRLRDAKNKRITNFKGINRYPVQKRWRVKATFIPFDSTHTMNIPTIVGEPATVKIPGMLAFKIDGKSYRIMPIQETPDASEWFIVFGDQTNGKKTYGGGRFIYIDIPKDNNTTFVDFNKAYNPPCAFTDFATCPLPPAENKLAIAVTAGERKYDHRHHN